jgi:DNA-binding NarL/FixJ family response regulator
MGNIRVLLADDHHAVLERVCELLGEDYEVVAKVRNGRDAVMETERLDPDVLVIDISMPILSGLAAAQRLQTAKLRTKVVFLTVHEDKDFVAAAFSAGASGYVTKENVDTDLVPAIRDAFEGRMFVSKSTAQ